MKMVMAVVPKEEASEVVNALVSAGHTATFGESRGGVLRQASQTLFIAVQDEELDTVLNVIRHYCHSPVSLASAEATPDLESRTAETAEVGGAVVFVWELEYFQRY